MIGKCPHCDIELNKPPFGNRITNEVMLTLGYRKIIDQGKKIPSFKEIGYCKICKATKGDLLKQRELQKPVPLN